MADTSTLLAQARAGDGEAFGELVGPLRTELHAHAYRMLGSVHDADDAVQETLLRAWRALGSFELRDAGGASGGGTGSLRPWLFRIATNRCLTIAERRGRRELPTDPDPGAEPLWLEPYPATDPEGRALAREDVELAFVAALQRLPATPRAAVLLRDVLGFAAAEVAQTLDTTVAAVNSALQRGRRALAERTTGAPDADAERDLARRYAAAWEAGDVDAVVGMLADDVRYSMPPEPAWYRGRDDVTAFLHHAMDGRRWRFVPGRVSGQLAFATYLLDGDRYRPGGLDLLRLGPGGVTEVVSFLTADFRRYGFAEELPA